MKHQATDLARHLHGAHHIKMQLLRQCPDAETILLCRQRMQNACHPHPRHI